FSRDWSSDVGSSDLKEQRTKSIASIKSSRIANLTSPVCHSPINLAKRQDERLYQIPNTIYPIPYALSLTPYALRLRPMVPVFPQIGRASCRVGLWSS